MVNEKYLTHGTVHTPNEKDISKAFEDVHHREEFIKRRRVMNGGSEKESLPEVMSVAHASLTKRNPDYHYIHGKAYDLRSFMKSHPGGEDILKMTQGLVDATPTFESYHAFANRPMIMKQLESYRVIVSEEDEKQHEMDTGMYSFKEDGFYRTLTRKIRAEYGATGENADKKSLTKETKANAFWLAKVSIQIILSLVFFVLTFYGSEVLSVLKGQKYEMPLIPSLVCALLAGNLFIQWGFTVMHDASHFAILPRNHPINTIATRVWCACSLWVCKLWMLHHAVLHHAFTGAPDLDPDLYHAMPFVRKHPDTPRSTASRIFRFFGENFGMLGWGFASAILYVFAPGMWFGQVLQYFAFSFGILHWKDLWGMTYPKNDAYDMRWYEYMLIGAHVFSHLYRANVFVSYAFMISLNFSYAMCIVADHDTADAAVLNHIDVDREQSPHSQQIVASEPDAEPKPSNSEVDESNNYGKVDWGEAQVRNSSNFCNHWAHDLFAFLNGSINYQIEHHLFPGMSHIHLPKIAPIVRETCEEFNIPYAAYTSLPSAWYSFLVTVRACMSTEDYNNLKQA